MEKVILVDQNDTPIGEMEKIEAHEKALLHRAFSILIFNSKNELLVQQRAHSKYHSPGLWTNTCCSHQRPGEKTIDAANRRLAEEMGMTAKLEPSFSFIYKAPFDNGLTEHEFDHVLVGYSDELPQLNPAEAADYSYKKLDEIKLDMKKSPQRYTAWFKILLEKL
jgi:isopentenyl-diphosphate delta-isomerase